VTKLQQMLTSLVAAIPAAYLGYELVMAMISYSENLSTIAYIVMGLTLLCAAAAVLIPIAVMVGGNRKPVPEKIPVKKQESGEDIEALDDEVEVSEESSGSHEEIAESSDFDLSDSSDETLAHGSDDNLSTDDIEEFDLDDEDEDVKPKSKKKKR
jgi:uncharacterized membrane protein YuzA (DUF378 family)